MARLCYQHWLKRRVVAAQHARHESVRVIRVLEGARCSRETWSVAQTIEEVLLAHGGVVRADIVGADVGRVMRHRQMMFHNLRKKRAYVFAVILYCTFGAYSICGQSLTRPPRLCAHHAETHAHARMHMRMDGLAHARMRMAHAQNHAHAHARTYARARRPARRFVLEALLRGCGTDRHTSHLRCTAGSADSVPPGVLGFSAASCVSAPGQASPHRPTLRRRRTEEAEFPK